MPHSNNNNNIASYLTYSIIYIRFYFILFVFVSFVMFRFVRLLFLNAYSGLLAAQAIPPRSMVTLVLAPSSRTQPQVELQRTMTGEREGEVRTPYTAVKK